MKFTKTTLTIIWQASKVIIILGLISLIAFELFSGGTSPERLGNILGYGDLCYPPKETDIAKVCTYEPGVKHSYGYYGIEKIA